ncbi:MAG: 30S ribosomal protein S9 [Candidatus Yonathbacteria bacterium RIFCSPHIGHO2_01_FULL_51_10]|uniref:Small ribosomal subunit protein uS9 n=1 Tax=Candidatus Yonathbacteria bacterium RIFCSPHIGHO2_01_FULL_51_10 TaxID=1802723 RepID=A0A1G2S5J9_9BACT|nr:MAG: 30S ribosomal protein S9 [Candidatus Yonathbacteria bacterium RIFCSPHIGHO2_01_FULL_51_10]
MEKDSATKERAPKKSLGGRYLEAVGRRKTAVARVRISEAAKTTFVVNDRALEELFPTAELQKIIRGPLTEAELPTKFHVSVHTNGGGVHAQAEAIRHGLSRILVAHDDELRKKLKKLGFLKRDPRMKERRKFGLKKARKAPQWSKR